MRPRTTAPSFRFRPPFSYPTQRGHRRPPRRLASAPLRRQQHSHILEWDTRGSTTGHTFNSCRPAMEIATSAMAQAVVRTTACARAVPFRRHRRRRRPRRLEARCCSKTCKSSWGLTRARRDTRCISKTRWATCHTGCCTQRWIPARDSALQTMRPGTRAVTCGPSLSCQTTIFLPVAMVSLPALVVCHCLYRLPTFCASLACLVPPAWRTTTWAPTPPSTRTMSSDKLGPPLTPTASSHKSRAPTFRRRPLCPNGRHRCRHLLLPHCLTTNPPHHRRHRPRRRHLLRRPRRRPRRHLLRRRRRRRRRVPRRRRPRHQHQTHRRRLRHPCPMHRHPHSHRPVRRWSPPFPPRRACAATPIHRLLHRRPRRRRPHRRPRHHHTCLPRLRRRRPVRHRAFHPTRPWATPVSIAAV